MRNELSTKEYLKSVAEEISQKTGIKIHLVDRIMIL